jgi:tagaturonate reductase
MNTLHHDHLDDISPDVQIGPLSAFPVKAVQIGEGNFLRAFFSWMVNELNSRGLFNGSIALVQPRQGGRVRDIAAQDNMFTIVSRGLRDGRPVEQFNVCTAISSCIDPYTHWLDFLQLAREPELQLLVSNTTEAGLVYTPCDQPQSACPASFPAKVTALLYERFMYFAGATDKGLALLPCELSENNGRLLADCVRRHAADWRLDGGFIRWFDEHCLCCNTLVDRIVPGFPAGEASALFERLGVRDDSLCLAELYHSWVIEADARQQDIIENIIPLKKGGLNISYTPDLARSRALKVRFLNGLHTATVLTGYLCGCETVRDCTDHRAQALLIRPRSKKLRQSLMTIVRLAITRNPY